MTEIKLPHLGENIESGQVVSILVSVGDHIDKDQNILEVETDKASIEVPADAGGVVKKIHVNDGDTITIGQVILSLQEKIESQSDGQTTVSSKAAPSDSEEVPMEDKVEAPPTNDANEIDDADNRPSIPVSASPVIRDRQHSALVPAAPSTRRFAREIGIDIGSVPGTGAKGRILIEDVKAFAKRINLGVASGSGNGTIETRLLPDFTKWGETQSVPMSNVRRATAEHLSHAWRSIPHVTQFDKADITELDKQRKVCGQRDEFADAKLTITGILMKIVSDALRQFPQFNSSIDIPNKTIIHKSYCNIGIAVDTDRGLIVPVVRKVDEKNLVELSSELTGIAQKARDRKVGVEDMQGGTFTISNLGGLGGTAFTPVVNWPEVAILGIAKSQIEPVYIAGQFQPRTVVTLALSYDHRAIDGADGVKFLRWIVDALENPMVLAFI